MAVAEFISILVIALILSLIFVYLLNAKGPWGSFWTFFLIVLFGLWAVGFWLSPVGPLLYGAPWVSFLGAGLVLALLLAASEAPSERRRRKKAREPGAASAAQPDTATKVSAVFWLLLSLFALAIIIGVAF